MGIETWLWIAYGAMIPILAIAFGVWQKSKPMYVEDTIPLLIACAIWPVVLAALVGGAVLALVLYVPYKAIAKLAELGSDLRTWIEKYERDKMIRKAEDEEKTLVASGDESHCEGVDSIAV